MQQLFDTLPFFSLCCVFGQLRSFCPTGTVPQQTLTLKLNKKLYIKL